MAYRAYCGLQLGYRRGALEDRSVTKDCPLLGIVKPPAVAATIHAVTTADLGINTGGRDGRKAAKVDDVVEFLKNKVVGFERHLVMTCKQADVTQPKGSSVLFLDAAILVDLKGGELKFNKKMFQQYLNAFREVQFAPENGNLRVNGELIVTIPLKTMHYYFACYLWEQFGMPIPSSKMKKYVCEKRGRSYDRDADQFCHDQRGKIKALVKGDERKEKLIASIFVTSPTQDGQNGSVMQNPI